MLGVRVLTRYVRGPENTCPACGHNSPTGMSLGCIACGWQPDGVSRRWDYAKQEFKDPPDTHVR